MAKIEGTTAAYNSYSNSQLNTHRAVGIPMPYAPSGDDPTMMAITTTNVSVYSNNMKIGFIQSFSPQESRTITPVQELGTEGVVQMVPGNTQGGQISVSRFALYNSDLWNALGLTPSGQFTNRDDSNFINDAAFTKREDSGTYGNPFRTLKEQRVPLEIRSRTVLPNVSKEAAYIETFFDCWLSNYSKAIQSNNVLITETATIQYADMTSTIVMG